MSRAATPLPPSPHVPSRFGLGKIYIYPHNTSLCFVPLLFWQAGALFSFLVLRTGGWIRVCHCAIPGRPTEKQANSSTLLRQISHPLYKIKTFEFGLAGPRRVILHFETMKLDRRRCVVGWVLADVSKDRSALIFKASKIHKKCQSRLTLALFMATECFKEAAGALETSAITHPTGLEPSLTPLREPKNSHDKISFCYQTDGRQNILTRKRHVNTVTSCCSFWTAHSHLPYSPSPQPHSFVHCITSRLYKWNIHWTTVTQQLHYCSQWHS